MNREISDQQVDLEIQPGYRPPAIDSGITMLPLCALGDREFELLIYLLVKSEIESGRYEEISKIALMQGVGERGRDCSLYKDNSVCGLIQCKKYAGRVSRPQIIKEIVKFLLFSVDDKSLLPDPDNFQYKIYVSNDLTGPAIVLVHSFEQEISLEISSGKIKKYAEDIIEEYESFSKFHDSPPFSEIESLIKRITVSSSNATDLSGRIYRNDHILKLFFNVKSIVSIEDADKVVRKAMDDYGLKYLTDDDLKGLKDRIESPPDSQRINLGLVDFYGFDKKFFRYLKEDGLKEVLTKSSKIKQFLDSKLLEFVQEEINKRVFSEITENLLYTQQIHQFSVLVASPYLFQRLSPIITSSNLPNEVMNKIFPKNNLSKDELIEEVTGTLLSQSEKIMQGDYSDIVGDEEFLKFKIGLYKHLHHGFSTTSDIKGRLVMDLRILMPVIDKIESEVIAMLSQTRTIVIKDNAFLENGAELKKILDISKVIDTSKT